MRVLLTFFLLLAGAVGAPAQQQWTLTEITDGSVPAEIVADSRELAIDVYSGALPDGRIATIANTDDVASAWYSEPTGRYTHGVLGDAIEAGALKIKTPRGETKTFRLPRTEVFEDLTPRLADLDDDGRTEIITILSSVTQGASLAIFGVSGNALVKQAQSSFIGRSNRWLNIAETGNFTKSFTPEIALVKTPHIGGTLQFYKYQSGNLILIVSARSFSNHVIGSTELRLSTQTDLDGNGSADLVIPSADRRSLLVLGFTSTGLIELARVAMPAAIDKAIGVEGSGSSTRFLVGLEDGKIYAVHR